MNRLPEPIEWLTDNLSPHVAGNTRRFGRAAGLVLGITSARKRYVCKEGFRL